MRRTLTAAAVATTAGLGLLAPPASAAPVTSAAAGDCHFVGGTYARYYNSKVGEYAYDTSVAVAYCTPGGGNGYYYVIANKHSSGITGWSGEVTTRPLGDHLQTVARPPYNSKVKTTSYGLGTRLLFKYTYGGHAYLFDYRTN